MLLDEPTTGLDPALRLEFYDIIEQLRAARATVVLSSHALAELAERAQRVVIMSKGRDRRQRLDRGPPADSKLAGEDTSRGSPPGEGPRLSNLLSPVASCREINGHVLELEAAGAEKIEILRRATGSGSPAKDISVVPPTLDDLYAHFLRIQERGL